MARMFSVMFRGEEIDAELTNADACEWHFYGLTTEQHNALNITPDEEEDVLYQLHEKYMDDVMSSCPEDF
jgi:hypothetical protein